MILSRVLFSFLTGLGLTVVLEAVFGFILGYRSAYEQLVILLTNVITNPLLNIILTVVSFYLSKDLYYWFLVPLEVLIVISEGLIYRKMIKKEKRNPFLTSFILNACSYFIGTLILKLL